MSDQIQMIKTALSDPACESVEISWGDDPLNFVVWRYPYEFDLFQSHSGELPKGSKIKVNHATFPDIEEGDIVSAVNGDMGKVILVNEPIYSIDIGANCYEHYVRKELVLLSKAK